MSNLSSWKLGTSETGKSCGYNKKSRGKFRVYIAKIMPLIGFGSPSSKSISLNKSCFCNASACKPTVSSNVKSQNYIDVPLAGNANISSVSSGTTLKVEILSGNVDRMYVISRL